MRHTICAGAADGRVINIGLPKQGTVFTIDLPLEPVQGSTEPRKLSFDLYGDAFNYRPADRIAKKWKAGTGAGGVDLQ